MRRIHSKSLQAFSLVELLVVIVIMIILVTGATLSLRGVNSSGQFNKALAEISGLLEEARSYAVAQNTYVWVVLYQDTPANGGPLGVYAAAYSSGDGTDPFGWAGSVTIPPGTVGSTTLSQVTHIYKYRGIHLETTTLPSAPTTTPPATPATAPTFQITTQSDSGPVTLSGTSSVYWLIQFTPTGAARVGPSPVDSVWLGLQAARAQTTFDPNNIASIKISGLTGVTTVYRQ